MLSLRQHNFQIFLKQLSRRFYCGSVEIAEIQGIDQLVRMKCKFAHPSICFVYSFGCNMKGGGTTRRDSCILRSLYAELNSLSALPDDGCL